MSSVEHATLSMDASQMLATIAKLKAARNEDARAMKKWAEEAVKGNKDAAHQLGIYADRVVQADVNIKKFANNLRGLGGETTVVAEKMQITRFRTQQFMFAIQDFISAGGITNFAMGIRGAANNLEVMAIGMHPLIQLLPTLGLAAILVGQQMMQSSKQTESAAEKMKVYKEATEFARQELEKLTKTEEERDARKREKETNEKRDEIVKKRAEALKRVRDIEKEIKGPEFVGPKLPIITGVGLPTNLWRLGKRFGGNVIESFKVLTGLGETREQRLRSAQQEANVADESLKQFDRDIGEANKIRGARDFTRQLQDDFMKGMFGPVDRDRATVKSKIEARKQRAKQIAEAIARQEAQFAIEDIKDPVRPGTVGAMERAKKRQEALKPLRAQQLENQAELLKLQQEDHRLMVEQNELLRLIAAHLTGGDFPDPNANVEN